MKHLLARLTGLDREVHQRDYAIRRLNDQIDALEKSQRKDRSRIGYQERRNNDLVELLDAQQEQAAHAARLIRDARKVINLRNSGPTAAREHMTQAIQLLEGDKQ